MEQLWFYIGLGFNHVIDFNGLDHFYFLIVLTLPFSFRDWKKLLWWVTLFTLGHTLSLLAAYLKWVVISSTWVEFLIPITIIFTAIAILLQKGSKTSRNRDRFTEPVTLVFGLIHGLGFGRYFSQIAMEEEAYELLVAFAFGVEVAQLLIVLGVITVNAVVYFFYNKAKIKWQLIIAAMVLSQAVSMAIENFPV